MGTLVWTGPPPLGVVDDHNVDMLIKSIGLHQQLAAHYKLDLNFHLNKHPFLEYILQKYSCNVFQADLILYFLK